MNEAQYIAKGLIQFIEEGLDKALAGAEGLEKSANRATEAFGKTSSVVDKFGKTLAAVLQAPARLLDTIHQKIQGLATAISNSGLYRLAQFTAIGGAAGIGGILYGASRDTVEANQLHMAIERLAEVVGDKLAPYFRMATQAVQELTQFWIGLNNELKISVTKWALVVTAISGFILALPLIVSGIAAVVGAIGTVVAVALSPWTILIGAVVAVGAAIGLLLVQLGVFGQGASAFVESWFPALKTVGEALEAFWDTAKRGVENFWSAWTEMCDNMIVAFSTAANKLGVMSDKMYSEITKTAKRRAEDRDTENFLRNDAPGMLPDAGFAARPPRADKGEKRGPNGEILGPDGNPVDFAGRKGNRAPADDPWAAIRAAWGRVMKAGERDIGFGRGTATFESGDATTNRLQLAAANQDPLDIAKAQLEEARNANDRLQKIADNTKADNRVVAE